MRSARSAEEYIDCPVCDKDDTEFFRIENNWKLVRCRECRLIYINPRPVERGALDKLSTQYSDEEYSEKINSYISQKYLTMLRARKLFLEVKQFKKSGRMLDIGCGPAYHLLVAKELGYEAYGVENSQTFCDLARNELGLNVSAGTIHQAYYPSNFFSVITMLNVLSHLNTPVEDLCEIHRVLEKDGVFVLETGNYGELKEGFLKKYKLTWDAPEHMYWYSEDNLKAILRKSGFEPIIINRYSTFLEQLIINSRLADSVRSIAWRKRVKSEKRSNSKHYPKQTGIKAGILQKIYARIYVFIQYSFGKWANRSGTPATLIVFAKKL